MFDAAKWMIDEQKVDVINVSQSHAWESPGDGIGRLDGFPLKAVEKAVENGIVWINSAGNDASSNMFYDALGTDETERWDDDGWLNFSNIGTDTDGVLSNKTTFRPNRISTVILRWSDTESADLDLYVCDNAQCSGNVRRGNVITGLEAFPIERFIGIYGGTRFLRVCLRKGVKPEWVQLGNFLNAGTLEYSTPFGSIRSPAESSSKGMLAVGAANASKSGEDHSYQLETFSSRGPDGNRVKPDIVGVDNEPSSFGVWQGTSQAAPHIAGMAALLLQRYPNLTPAEVVDKLKEACPTDAA